MEPTRRVSVVNIPSRGTQKECMCLADPWIEVSSLVFAYCFEAVFPFLPLPLFKSSVVVLSWNCLWTMEVLLSDPDHRNEFSYYELSEDNSLAMEWK